VRSVVQTAANISNRFFNYELTEQNVAVHESRP
jgi:hypothetical protein